MLGVKGGDCYKAFIKGSFSYCCIDYSSVWNYAFTQAK